MGVYAEILVHSTPRVRRAIGDRLYRIDSAMERGDTEEARKLITKLHRFQDRFCENYNRKQCKIAKAFYG